MKTTTEKIEGIRHELETMSNYIDTNPDNAITDTLWHTGPETMRDALLRISEELSTLVRPNANDQTAGQ